MQAWHFVCGLHETAVAFPSDRMQCEHMKSLPFALSWKNKCISIHLLNSFGVVRGLYHFGFINLLFFFANAFG